MDSRTFKDRLGRSRRRYVDCALANYVVYDDRQKPVLGTVQDYLDMMPGVLGAGGNLLFWGSVGTGKDHLLASLLREVHERYGYPFRWHTGVDFSSLFREAIDGPSYASARLTDDLSRAALLVISDVIPPSRRVTDYQKEMLYEVVDRRYCAGRPTWMSCNGRTEADIENCLSAPILDRIRDGGSLIRCQWPSYRDRRCERTSH